MKTQNLMLKALCAFAATAAVSVGCTGLKTYQIDAPDDLASKIAEYKAEKESKQSDDYTEIDITVPVVGSEDNTSGWWTEFSQYFTVPSGKKLVLEFENYGSMENNWNNWNACVCLGERDTDGYSEYFVIRSDAYGWGNADYNGAMIYFDYNGQEVNWDEFRVKMYGATVIMTLDHAKAGAAYFTAQNFPADDPEFVITETYNQPVSSTEDINLFLVCDASHFNVKKAYLVPSEIEEIPDEEAVSISVAGFPEAIEVGAYSSFEELLENVEVTGTVTFADNSIATVAEEDITFTASTTFGQKVGTETIVYSYSKTKQGNYGQAVGGYTTIDVSNPIDAIAATAYAYKIGGAKHVTLTPSSFEIIATYRDGSKAPLKSSQVAMYFTDDVYTYACEEGVIENVATLVYTAASGKELTAQANLVIEPSNQAPQVEMVGAEDFSNPWWTTFSNNWGVPAYTSQAVSMYVGSDNLGNWHSPCVIVRKADGTEYGVVRMDNYGWGTGYEGFVISSCNWNWDTFAANINGSQVAITVANGGDGYASVRYHVLSADGNTYFQYYDGFVVDSSDVTFALVTEESYLIFD